MFLPILSMTESILFSQYLCPHSDLHINRSTIFEGILVSSDTIFLNTRYDHVKFSICNMYVCLFIYSNGNCVFLIPIQDSRQIDHGMVPLTGTTACDCQNSRVIDRGIAPLTGSTTIRYFYLIF